MLYFIPWAVLILAVIVAVPVVVKMSPKSRSVGRDNGEEEVGEYSEGDDQGVLEDDFGAGGLEAVEDEEFEELK